jgi:hypothetical protein
MVAKTSIYLDLISEYKDKGAKQAESSFARLGKSALSLAKSYGVAFSGAALVAFSVKAIKAAADEDKAFAVLGNTLKNLGLSFAATDSKSFIENLALGTGVTIDKLIPAYQNLLVATGNVAQSQRDLKTAMDVTAGTGTDLETVTKAISKGYLGNTVGLMKLGAGLDKVLVKTGRMDLIMKQLSNTFKGGAATAANTAAGAMARVSEATHLATVSIGEGLIYAFESLGSGSSVTGATSAIVDFGTAISNAIKGVGDLIAQIKNLVYLGPILGPLLKGLAWIIDKTNPEILLTKALGKLHTSTVAKSFSSGEASGQYMLDLAAQKKVLANKAAQKKLEADILASQKKQTLEQKQQALLKILGSPQQDFEIMNLQAALQKDISASARDSLNYQLLFLQAQNQTGAALTKSIDDLIIMKEKGLIAQGQVMLIDGSIVNLKDAKNPFAGFDKYVQDALAAILLLNQAILNMPSVMPGGYGTYGGSGIAPGYGVTYGPGIGAQGDTTTPSGPIGRYGVDYGPGIGATNNQTVSLSISLDPGLIVNTTNASTANGSAITINRTSNQFASV